MYFTLSLYSSATGHGAFQFTLSDAGTVRKRGRWQAARRQDCVRWSAHVRCRARPGDSWRRRSARLPPRDTRRQRRAVRGCHRGARGDNGGSCEAPHAPSRATSVLPPRVRTRVALSPWPAGYSYIRSRGSTGERHISSTCFRRENPWVLRGRRGLRKLVGGGR